MEYSDSDDCFDPRQGLVPIADAEQRILDSVQPVSESDVVPLHNALDRVLYESATSDHNVPPHANSAMDGYAVAASSLPKQGSRKFRIAGTAFAGKPWGKPCALDEVVQVMTGAVMPDGTDTVVIQEEASVSDGIAEIRAGQKPFQNVRSAGEDIAKGSIAVKAGTRLGAAELGVLASTGKDHVQVYKQPLAAVFSTGDEVMNAGEPLVPGRIYDSNRYTIMGLLQRTGLKVMNLGIIQDKLEATLASLEEASKKANIIITSGGVSTGSADYVIKALQQLGEVQLWRIAIRPGRPFAYGRIGNALFFGLPGNPVAVMVTYFRLVEPALRKLMGEANFNPAPIVSAKAITQFRKKPNRTEVYRAILSYDSEGEPVVESTGDQGSGLLQSMSRANCFVLLNDQDESAQPGDMVKIQLFESIF